MPRASLPSLRRFPSVRGGGHMKPCASWSVPTLKGLVSAARSMQVLQKRGICAISRRGQLIGTVGSMKSKSNPHNQFTKQYQRLESPAPPTRGGPGTSGCLTGAALTRC